MQVNLYNGRKTVVAWLVDWFVVKVMFSQGQISSCVFKKSQLVFLFFFGGKGLVYIVVCYFCVSLVS